ncbi:hypothetical protein [Methylobacterium nodulans]|uniref:Uncharacterized protein n=1 Tax=Methylobacterium nodulans (strain LMG 21967 / CNCM I-2342 / ORS 2060) TaxID=460265 RepID=B8IXC2_METNO|nr:hypothetical protein [Methylobacterium nodulans]ACL63163.1 hypothetical protein Mnod_8188 [Methylobacterium nodulans ORS 2060]
MDAEAGDLIDRIYEAAVLPEFWPNVLSDLARFGEGDAPFSSRRRGTIFVT